MAEPRQKTLAPEIRMGLAALAWSISGNGDMDGVARAVNAAGEPERLPADYLELYHLLRALCMAPGEARADYRLIVRAALQRLPEEARKAGAQGRDAPYWLKD